MTTSGKEVLVSDTRVTGGNRVAITIHISRDRAAILDRIKGTQTRTAHVRDVVDSYLDEQAQPAKHGRHAGAAG